MRCDVTSCRVLPRPKLMSLSSGWSLPLALRNRSGLKTAGSFQCLSSWWMEWILISTTVSCTACSKFNTTSPVQIFWDTLVFSFGPNTKIRSCFPLDNIRAVSSLLKELFEIDLIQNEIRRTNYKPWILPSSKSLFFFFVRSSYVKCG